MKKITLFPLMLLSVFAFSQNTAFKMPAEITFDKNVEQKINEKKEGTLSYYFTTSGDYLALKPESKEGTLIIYTKEGEMLMVNEKEKSIIVMNMKGFINKAKETANDKNAKDATASKSSVKKTGKTKTICGYPAEEYEVTTEKDKMNVWYLKADFNSALLKSMGMGAGPAGKTKLPNSDLGDLPGIGTNFFMAEMEKDGKKVIETVSINKTDYKFSSAGYSVQDMSSLMKGYKQQ